jgi:hypothetical protein
MTAITTGALVKRINRRMTREDRKLRRARGAQFARSFGTYYVWHVRDRRPIETHVDPIKFGAALGVLHPHEEVAQ